MILKSTPGSSPVGEAVIASLPLPRSDQPKLRIQLWAYNYDPEPIGIGPVSTLWAETMRDRGHEVDVVSAHPHYPSPLWGRHLSPSRQTRNGIDVLRLPLWVGRATSMQRLRQELSFTVSQTLALGGLGTPDVLVAVSPSFPALAPAMLNARLRKVPWVLWLQDILPDGAAATGLIRSGALLRTARRLERAAYRSASRIVVISRTFEENLLQKGVSREKIDQIYNPATRSVSSRIERPRSPEAPRLLTMGNIGYSQGLWGVVRAFQGSAEAAGRDARLVITGDGVAAEAVRAEITDDRVEMLGLVSDERLERELRRASLGVISQRADLAEFNLPSKLMNFMAYGVPVLAFVRADSEAAHLVEQSGAGWVADSARPEQFEQKLAGALRDPDELDRRGAAGFEFAQRNFRPERVAALFEDTLLSATADRARAR